MLTNSAGFRFVEIGSSDIERSLDFHPVGARLHPRRSGAVAATGADAAVRRLVGCGAEPVTDAESMVSGLLVTDPDGVPLRAVTAR